MEDPNIDVAHSGFVRLPAHVREGVSLIVAEDYSLPFKAKRVFYITHLRPGLVRGQHAHKESEQIIFCVNGSFDLLLDDGTKKQILTLSDPALGIRLGPRLWHVMQNFTEDCVILVFADAPHNDAEVIRSYDEFLSFIRQS